tara:strand:- start:284 stop:499 length:216 start_codon:yes stop_codon:yes gene_type:complete
VDYTRLKEKQLHKAIENSNRSLFAIIDEMSIGPGKARLFAKDLINASQALATLEEIAKPRAPKKKAAVKQD